MLKKEARKIYREKRMALSAPERAKLDDLMLVQFQTLQIPFIHALLTYWPIEENNEPETDLLAGYLEFKNPALKILYPKSDFTRTAMEAIEIEADTAFQKSVYNIHEPLSGTVIAPSLIDMVLVPMLVCDKNGYRVGYGKGFYDKFLAQCSRRCIKVGLTYFEPIDKINDSNDFDVPLSFCITPHNVYVF